MRLTIERSNLIRALARTTRVVERRNTIPILSNVLLRAEGDALHMKATDLDLEVAEEVSAHIDQLGATTVPAHLLHDIVRKLPDGSEVQLRTSEDGNGVSVAAGRSNFRLQTLPEGDFPDLTAGEFTNSFAMPAAELAMLIERTAFAISTEETRYYLNGIYCHVIEGHLRAVATDGHRLARAEVDAPEGTDGMPGIIVPRKTVGEVQKLLGAAQPGGEGEQAQIRVQVSDAKIRFSLGGVVLTSKLIDGTFPDYQRVIPAANDKALTLDRQSFASAVDRVATVSSERGRAVKLALGEGQLTLTVNNPDSGSAEEELAVGYEDDAMEIGFNARYLLDIAAQITGEEAVFMLNDAGSPTLIRDRGDERSLYVLMPMRV